MMPFRNIIEKNIEKIKDYDIDMIAPSHGQIYDKPARMVDRLSSALDRQGVRVELFNLAVTDIGKLAISLVDATTIVVGTPTVLAGPHPLAAYATFLANALRPKPNSSPLSAPTDGVEKPWTRWIIWPPPLQINTGNLILSKIHFVHFIARLVFEKFCNLIIFRICGRKIIANRTNEEGRMKPDLLKMTISVLTAALILVSASASALADEKENSKRFGHQAMPTQQLSKEHDITLKMADAAVAMAAKLRTGEKVERQRLANMCDFFVKFVDACHHGKEEQYYFPAALVAKPDLASVVTTLKLHHEIGKSLLSGVDRSLVIWDDRPEQARREAADNLAAYAALLKRHIDAESEMMEEADAAFSEEQSSLVRAGFHYVEAEQLGEGFHEKYHALAMKLLKDQK